MDGYMSIILMLESSVSSSMTETCDNCDNIRMENRKLTKRLTAFLKLEEELLVLGKVKKELEGIATVGAELNIKMEDFAEAIAFALDTHFAIKSKPLVEKAKAVVKQILSLTDRQPERKEEGKDIKKEEKDIKKEAKEIKAEK
jgi:hypothetical protein